jgi:hypothetical protein
MLERTSRLEAIQFAEDGTLLVRIQKRVCLDGEVLKEEWHRTSIPPGDSVDAQMAMVNDHLVKSGFDPVPEASIKTLGVIAKAVQTDELAETDVVRQEAPREGIR